MDDKEKEIIKMYLVHTAKDKIKNARLASVDFYAAFFVAELVDLGAEKEAKEIIDFYIKTWS